MVDINYQNLPAPMGFSIDIEDLELWDYYGGEDDEASPELVYAFRSDSMDVIYGEMEPGQTLPWHTHEPHTSQLYWVLAGKMRTNYKDQDGEQHSIEVSADDQELVYLPAGAHNQLESIGEEALRFFSFKDNGGTVRGRLEHYVGDPDEHYDPKEDVGTPGIDLLPLRGHIFDMQEDAITEW